MIITFDGPTASGKGSVARAVAHKRGMYYLDTGALYRAIGYMVSLSFSREQVQKVTLLDDQLIAGIVNDLTYRYEGGEAHLAYKGDDITQHLRTPAIDWYSSHTSQVAAVREGVRILQRKLGRIQDLVADGRDCGTVTFPDAAYKFFLTASLEVRVDRVLGDTQRATRDGIARKSARRAVVARDLRDITRTLSPLQPAYDAIIIDNSTLNKQETLDLIFSYL